MAQTLGKRIVQHRKRLGLTQDQLAEKLGVTAQAVSKWENDQSCPDISMLPKLAAIFGITTDALLGAVSQEPVYESEVVDEKEDTNLFHVQKGNWEFTWDSSKKSALGFALFVLAVGGQLLAARFLKFDIGFWGILWPTALIMLGLTELTKKFSFFSLGCILFGGYFLLDDWQILSFSMGSELIFPAILVIFGLSLLADALKRPKKSVFHVNHNSKKKNNYTIGGERFTYEASFGSEEQFISIPRLSLGKISTSFGEYSVDLSGVEEVSDHCMLDASCSFGELTLLVPRRFQVQPTSSTFFAELEIEGHPDPLPEGIISVKSSANFSEITIQYI